ncbi:hypothetical protein K413DRAFT_3065 [Clostridium sp. ASBs410]|nr:hypothetical protein K413DRAFT_3065 [Clostridium sp. ASBs410]
MNQTNDETIWNFYKYIIGLPDQEYYLICKYMRANDPIPGMTEKIICKSDKKREKITEYAKITCR